MFRKHTNVRKGSFSLFLLAAFLLAGYALYWSTPFTSAETSGRSIVILQNGVDPDTFVREEGKRFGFAALRVYRQSLRGFAAVLSPAAHQSLSGDRRVRYIVVDALFQASAQTLPTHTDRVDADLNAGAAINSIEENVDVDIAILDTGVDLDHPDLNVFQSISFVDGSSADDKNGHGTHVAGIATAKDNSIGVVGIAPGARIWAVKVLGNSGSGWLSDVIAGIDWVTLHSNEIDVANMSLGGSGSDDGQCGLTNNDPMHEAICASVAAGVTYVVAAGNESADAAAKRPTSYNEVITVSAIVDTDGKGGSIGSATSYGADDTFASFSNFGADVDFAAPGVSILSTDRDGKYSKKSGTSMASPSVAGAAGLIRAATPGLAPDLVKQELFSFSLPQGEPGAFRGDPDSFPEPLLNVSPIVAYDLAVDSVTAPSSVLLGELVTVTVTVENEGRLGASSDLTLIDESTGRFIGSQFVVQYAKTASKVQFVWNTAGLALGTHVLRASITPILGESDTADNVGRVSVKLTDTAPKKPRK